MSNIYYPRNERLAVKNNKGKNIRLKYNEPRPNLTQKPIPSKILNTKSLGLAGLRMEVEGLLSSNCREKKLEKIKKLGSRVAPVLLKIATNQHYSCRFKCGMRTGAITALGFFPEFNSESALIDLSTNKTENIDVKHHALIALGNLGEAKGVHHLCQTLRTSKSLPLKNAAINGLKLALSMDAVNDLEKVIVKEKNPNLRSNAFYAIKSIEKHYKTKLTHLKEPKMPKRSRPKQIKHLSEKIK